MSGIFKKCTLLRELNLNNFITDNVTNMSNMFSGCKKLIKTSNYFTNFSNISQITKNICEFLDKDQYLLQTKEN